jgi:PAS domain S-box-containing protein
MSGDEVPPRLVLVLDSDKVWLSLVALALEVHGLRPTVATPARAIQAAQTFLPDVVVIGPCTADDVAVGVVEQIRSNPSLRTTPIIAIGNRRSGEVRPRLTAQPWIDVVSRSDHFDQIIESVHKRSRTSPGRQALRVVRRSLVGVRERAAAQRTDAVAMRKHMASLLERMQVIRISVLAGSPLGACLAVNDRLCALTGYDRTELVSRNVWDLAVPASKTDLRLHWERLASGDAFDGTFVVAQKDGLGVEVEVSLAPHVLPGIHLATFEALSESASTDNQP